jgi:hypothetical protein
MMAIQEEAGQGSGIRERQVPGVAVLQTDGWLPTAYDTMHTCEGLAVCCQLSEQDATP